MKSVPNWDTFTNDANTVFRSIAPQALKQVGPQCLSFIEPCKIRNTLKENIFHKKITFVNVLHENL